MEENDDESLSITNVDAELNQLLGLFDVPAFVRRGQELESALNRLHARYRREREEQLEMVRVRLRQWSSVATAQVPEGETSRSRRTALVPKRADAADLGRSPRDTPPSPQGRARPGGQPGPIQRTLAAIR